jgi:transcriptional regulator with XRE-family HTH domain
MHLSERVKLARTKRGVSQHELGERTGLSGGYISMLERPPGGKNAVESPGIEGLKKIAAALSVPETWLVLGVEPEPDWDDAPPASEPKPTGAKGAA